MVYHLKDEKEINELIEEKSFVFQNLKENVDPNNLMSRYRTEGISPKDFSNYQNLMDLFINLRDGSINAREVLKDQIKIKKDLGKKGNIKLKSKDQISVK